MVRHILIALLAAVAGCRPSPEPCSSPGTCPKGSECLANRCVPAGGEPVVAESVRRVVEPMAMVVVSARGQAADPLPVVATFGSSALGKTAMYLRFEPVWRGASSVDSAFLLLEPAGGAAPGADVMIRAWRVRERWAPTSIRWLEQPELAPPSAEGIARSAPPSVLRVDVTEIVRYLQAHPESDRGLALVAGSGDGYGASFTTGAGTGRAPRLEVYLR